MDRRQFIATTATSLVAHPIASSALGVPSPVGTPSDIPTGKDQRLKVIAADPLVLETPDSLLASERVTKTSALFVRNHHGARGMLSLDGRPMTGALEIVGLDGGTVSIPMSELANMQSFDVEMVLQCSGNFRSLFSKVSPIKGTPWNKGGIGNVRFTGIRISDVLKRAGVKIVDEAKYLTAEGEDQPEKEGQIDYEKSVPMEVAMQRGMLATGLNGEPLPAVHGGPLRLVIPGFYGSVQVKWLTRLRLESKETSNFHQLPDYRTPKKLIPPGSKIEYTFDNSDPNFEMKINSRIFSPADGSTVSADQEFRAHGVAWNDGAVDLTAVELSIDGGKTWRATRLGDFAGPFAFREWSMNLKLPAGSHSISVRALDAMGRTQPIDGALFWNPGGYAWNGIETISFEAT